MNKTQRRKQSSIDLDAYIELISGSMVKKEEVIELGRILCSERASFRLAALQQNRIIKCAMALIDRVSNHEVRWDFVFELSMKHAERLKEIQNSLPELQSGFEKFLLGGTRCKSELAAKINATGLRTVHFCRWHLDQLNIEQSVACEEITRTNQSYLKYVKAKHGLAATCLLLVVKIAHQFRNHDSTLMERVQDGNVGVMIAAEKYDPSLEWTFATYASHWIRQSIFNGFRKREFIRLPQGKSDRFRKCRSELSALTQQLMRNISVHEQAEFLNRDGISEPLFQAHFENAVSLDQVFAIEEGTPLAKVDPSWESCPLKVLERQEIQAAIGQAVSSLESRDRMVLEMRFGLNGESEHNVARISRLLRLSHYRVHKSIMNSLSQLQEELTGFR